MNDKNIEEKETLTHGSLFSGIGGFELGGEWSDIRTIWNCEIENFNRQQLKRLFPYAKQYKDIKQMQTPKQLTLFQEVSLAKTYHSLPQKIELVWMEIKADCGEKCLESVKRLNQSTSLSKIPTQSLQKDLTLFSKNLPKSGMMRSGKYYKVFNLAYHNADVDFTLYSTPLASETGWRKGKFSQGGTSLSTQLGGIPNLRFMEWLMSFPIGWISTEL